MLIPLNNEEARVAQEQKRVQDQRLRPGRGGVSTVAGTGAMHNTQLAEGSTTYGNNFFWDDDGYLVVVEAEGVGVGVLESSFRVGR